MRHPDWDLAEGVIPTSYRPPHFVRPQLSFPPPSCEHNDLTPTFEAFLDLVDDVAPLAAAGLSEARLHYTGTCIFIT